MTEVNLKPLFTKLGHNLEEIRVRALENILSKLKHNVVCDADLVQEKHLHIRLLEWFNFSSCPMQDDSLGLILKLSKHPSAATIYVDIGAVEFLTQLRPNVDVSLHRIIDGILDNLFHLPSIQPDAHSRECIYQQQGFIVTSGSQALPNEYLEPSYATDPDISAPEVVRGGGQRYTSPPEPQIGYFGQGPNQDYNTHPYMTQNATAAAASCFRFSTFPLLALTPTDKHVLSSTDNSLRSTDVSLVVSACEFLSDVVFQDFPAEVFLQRPTLIKSLLSLLVVPAADKNNVSYHAVCTLRDLAHTVKARIYYYEDPSLYTPKREFQSAGSSSSSSASFLSHSLGSCDRLSLVGHGETRPRGDGQDGDSSASTQSPLPDILLEETDADDMQSLHFLQWTTPQLCAAIMERVLPCLKTPDSRFITAGLELLQQMVELLRESVAPDSLWEDHSVPARELVEKFHESLEMLGDVMFLHHHGNLSASTPEPELVTHRQAFFGLSSFLEQLLGVMLPSHRPQLGLPDHVVPMLTLVVQDESLAYSAPGPRSLSLSLLQHLNPDAHNLYMQAQQTAHSLRTTCNFLSQVEDMTDDNVLQLLGLAEESLPALPYHLHLGLVSASVQLAAYICKKTSPNPVAVQQCRSLMLTLLAHPLAAVRTQAYSTAFTILKDCLSVERVVEPTSSNSQAVNFMLDRRVLYEVACFGAMDSEEVVRQRARELLLYLLQGQLLMPAARWQQLLDALMGVLPVLQGFSDPETLLSKCIMGLLDPEPHLETGCLPILERFRGTLRLMFCSSARQRTEALGKLAWFLAHETDSMRKLPAFSDLDVTNLTNLFIRDQPRALGDEDATQAVFQADGLRKVYDIYAADSVEATVRRSAAEQLGIMLQDTSLHVAFRQLGGVETLMANLKRGVCKPGKQETNPFVSVLPSAVKMLRCLVQYDSTLRQQMAQESELYYCVLRAGLLHKRDQVFRQELAELFALLLFDELTHVATWQAENREQTNAPFTLPAFIINRFSLPMHLPHHHLVSPSRIKLTPDPDPLTSGSLAELLRFTWNVAWNGDIERAVTAQRTTEDSEFSSRLLLSAADRVILRTSYITSGLQHCVHMIENATNHQSVIPSSHTDEQLLGDLMQLLTRALITPQKVPLDVLTWCCDVLHSPQGAVLNMLGHTEASGSGLPESTLVVRRQLQRKLLKFVYSYVGKFPYSLVDRMSSSCVRGDLAHTLMVHISRTDTTHFYNLASLESTLLCLMQVTARPGWSCGSAAVDSLTLCLQALHSLLEVVSAFHIGRGGASMSYMGRGVTRSAALCLRHLACEMATQLQSKDWPRNWLFSRQATAESMGESGLHWLIPLWSYRDTEVRASGVGIAAALASTEAGRITLTTQCQHIAGGIWGTAFSLLLDQTECSLVRQQAALLLVNLTSQPLPSEGVESTPHVWQGPIVRNEETQESLVGLPALLALLYHCQFYQEILTLITNFYPQPIIHPVSVATGSRMTTPVGSQATTTTSGSLTPAAVSRLTDASSSSGRPFASTPTDSLLQRPDTVGQNGDHLAAGIISQTSILPQGSSTSPSGIGQAGEVDGAHNQSSTTTGSDSSGPTLQSVATPCLVSAVCRLLSNLLALAPQDTISCIIRDNIHRGLLGLLDVGLLEAYVSELQVPPYRAPFGLSFLHLLQVHVDTVQLLQRAAIQDASIATHLLGDTAVLRQLVKLLGVTAQDSADSREMCCQLWEVVFSLLSCLLQQHTQLALPSLLPVIHKQWAIFSGRLLSLLQDSSLCEMGVWVAGLVLLALLLNEEGKLVASSGGERQPNHLYLVDRLDNPTPTDESDLFDSSSGSLLCQALVKQYDTVALRPLEQCYVIKMAVFNALKSLLTISGTAKVTALEAGLVESICDHIKHVHMKLNMDSLDVAKVMAANKKKENPLFTELIISFDLLRNFMYANSEVKLAACECGVGALVHQMWAWCQTDPTLMAAALQLLCTFTARCPKASSSLAFTTHMGVTEWAGDKPQHSPSSLVHCLIRLLQKEGFRGNLQLLRMGYALAATLTLSQECRGILWKSNFMQEFSKLAPTKPKKSKVSRAVEGLWLDLLVNLSFCVDGHELILKIDDSIALLLDFGQSSSEQNQKRAVLILRNLCFHTSNKPKLLSNEKLLPFMIRCVEAAPDEIKLTACSALHGLVHNSQKAKGAVKSAHIMRKLKDAYNECVNMQPQPWAHQCAQHLHDTILLLHKNT